MSKDIKLKDNQYIIDGIIKTDTEIVNDIMKWTLDNFIFRGGDVFLPNTPYPLSAKNLTKYQDLNISVFSNKYGNISLKYLIYNIFLLGYEAGIEKEKLNEKENLNEEIDKIIEESKPKTKEKTNTKKEEIEVIQPKEEIIVEEKKIEVEDLKIEEVLEEKEEVKENFVDKEELLSNTDLDIEEDDTDEDPEDTVEVDNEGRAIKYFYDKDKKLVIKSGLYSVRSIERVLCLAIEKRLNVYGITMDDIENSENPIPSFILGEILIDIDGIQTGNETQLKSKIVFYDYFKNLQEKNTKSNTIS